MSAGKGLRETGREFPDLSPARCYIVGGAVRDELLGLPVKDRDYVVVGSTAAAIYGSVALYSGSKRQPGFHQ